jgi:hypothetical protein
MFPLWVRGRALVVVVVVHRVKGENAACCRKADVHHHGLQLGISNPRSMLPTATACFIHLALPDVFFGRPLTVNKTAARVDLPFQMII